MIQDILARITESIATGDTGALVSLALVAALMEVGFPFPFVLSSALLIGGFEAGLISEQVLLLMGSLFLGRLIGASFLFWASRLMGGVLMGWLEKRKSTLPEKIARFASHLKHRVPIAITLARFTPGLLTVSSLTAGFIRVRYWPFAIGIVISSLSSDLVILLLGFLTFHGLKLMGITPTVWQLVIGLLIVTTLGWGVVYLVRRYRNRA